MTFGTNDQRILWPGYIYPDVWNRDASAWWQFGDQAPDGFDHTGSIAVANPASGPGTAVVDDWTSAINYVRDKGHRVIGYVHTSYGARPIADVHADVDTWYSLYEVDGIFVDEMSTNSSTTQPYYRDVYNYVRTKPGDHMVVGNPGTAATTDWQIKSTTRVCDLVAIFEDTAAAYLTWSPPSWTSGYAASWFAHLVHTTAAADYAAVRSHAEATGAGYVYITDQAMPNPWGSLAYWPHQATP